MTYKPMEWNKGNEFLWVFLGISLANYSKKLKFQMQYIDCSIICFVNHPNKIR